MIRRPKGQGGAQHGRRLFLIALIGVLALAAACADEPESPLPDGVLAMVDGEALLVEDFNARWRATADPAAPPPADPAALVATQMAYLDTVVARLLVEHEARSLNIAVADAEVEAALANLRSGRKGSLFPRGARRDTAWLRDQLHAALLADKLAAALLPDEPVDEAEARAWFDAHHDRLDRAETAHLRQIVCRDRETVVAVLADLLTGRDFAEAARAVSIAPEGRRGGDLGFVARGELLPEIEEAAFSLPLGEISTVLETPFGFHLIQVLERVPARTLTFELARQTIERELLRKKREARWREHLDRLRQAAAVVVDPRRLPGPIKEAL